MDRVLQSPAASRRPWRAAARREPPDAGSPGYAAVPAEATSTALQPRSVKSRRASASASGLRQVLPVQTNRTRNGVPFFFFLAGAYILIFTALYLCHLLLH